MSTDKSNIYKNYNPDILETIANLSNDEVFTPPKLANEILDLLPEEVWSNPNLTFLDPAVKTGIFLREIASRLIDGLAEEIPDLQERVNHILTKQVFGIGITELTTLMARRTVYCSTTANGKFSICTEFDDEKGNIVFPDTEHTWDKNGRCEYCGANEENYSGGVNIENYAYPFIHDNFEKEFGNMKFDVIIGNPPYQLSYGNDGRNSAMAKAIYHLFVEKSMELKPKYITMIIPSRWMTRTAAGVPKDWVDIMIEDKRFQEIHDFMDSEECFANVSIRGGVNYFLWNSQHEGKCKFNQHSKGSVVSKDVYLNTKGSGILIRDINALSIIDKVSDVEKKYLINDDSNFSSMISPKHFFTTAETLGSSWDGFSLKKDNEYNIEYHISKFLNGTNMGWIKEEDILRNKQALNIHKAYINAAGDNEKFGGVIAKPIYGKPGSVCSNTYLVVGYKHNLTKKEVLNVMSYMRTKFFRFMVDVKKATQNVSRSAYQFVPLQDWSKSWTDDELYKKYKLTQDEIDYIEDNIAEME